MPAGRGGAFAALKGHPPGREPAVDGGGGFAMGQGGMANGGAVHPDGRGSVDRLSALQVAPAAGGMLQGSPV